MEREAVYLCLVFAQEGRIDHDDLNYPKMRKVQSNIMRIALITGSYPPDVCGVGDYSFRLAEALRQQGISVEVIHDVSWRLFDTPRVFRQIRSMRPDIVHIQYPTIGFGSGLAPQMLSLLINSVVTIHEISKAHILRKISLFPFSVRPRHVIFTTPYERDFALSWAPWVAQCCDVIPLASNIAVGAKDKISDNNEIIYFGMIRPNKGIEQVLTLAELVKRSALPYRIRIIGIPYPGLTEYVGQLRQRSLDLPVTWSLDLSNAEVADVLSQSLVAYVPFPDGASGRRGTLLALLANGVATITTGGLHTTRELDDVVELAHSPEQALSRIRTLLNDPLLLRKLSHMGRSYARGFAWEQVAQRHINLYKGLLSKP
jgi:glycosyltransferase involved in cell wall biosynthesis